jgi:hypothetical protein
MSTTIVHQVRCPGCGASLELLLPESANVQRSAEWRQKVLDGTFNRFSCDKCGEGFVVERDTLYTDLLNGVMIGVFSRARRNERAALERQLADTWTEVVEREAPALVRASFVADKKLRVVFAMPSCARRSCVLPTASMTVWSRPSSSRCSRASPGARRPV